MNIDITAARNFVTTHGRVLDRRRLELLLDGTNRDGVVAALDAYQNPDGGYGWGLEPDLRAPGSQPVAAMQAFEVIAELAPTRLCVRANFVTGSPPTRFPTVASRSRSPSLTAPAPPRCASTATPTPRRCR